MAPPFKWGGPKKMITLVIPYLKTLFKNNMNVSDLFSPGLYQITCLKNNKVYIGQSTNVLNRLGRHCENLEMNRHNCKELQKDFNKYGKTAFKFESLEINSKFEDESLRKQKEKADRVQMLQHLNTNAECRWSLFHLHLADIKKLQNSYNKESNKFFTRYIQQVKIKNKVYNGLRKAEKETRESRANITRKCNSINNTNYVYLDQTIYDPAKINSIGYRINGKEYPTLTGAAKKLKQAFETVKNAVNQKII